LFIRFLNFPQIAPLIQLLGIVVFYNFLWGIFNLVPIPPLDGSWILFKLIPQRLEKAKLFLQQYGLYILIFFIFFGGLNGLGFIAQLLYTLVAGVPFSLF
jgi:Zn-dependent protease